MSLSEFGPILCKVDEEQRVFVTNIGKNEPKMKEIYKNEKNQRREIRNASFPCWEYDGTHKLVF